MQIVDCNKNKSKSDTFGLENYFNSLREKRKKKHLTGCILYILLDAIEAIPFFKKYIDCLRSRRNFKLSNSFFSFSLCSFLVSDAMNGQQKDDK